MDNLERNIKEAFDRQDAQSSFSGKESMWNRLDNELRPSKGVAALWRVAAIILVFLLASGVFAARFIHTNQQVELAKLELENAELSATVDSLQNLPVQIKREIEIVEKIVYKDRVVSKIATSKEFGWKEKYTQVADSVNKILDKNEFYAQEIEKLQKELAEIKQELTDFQNEDIEQELVPSEIPFQLKSEHIDIEIARKPTLKSSDVKMKIFQKNFIGNKNDLNTTIFKN